MGNVAGAMKSIKDAQKESHKLQAIKERQNSVVSPRMTENNSNTWVRVSKVLISFFPK